MRTFFLISVIFILSLASLNAYAVNERIGLLNASYNDPSSPSGVSSIATSDIPGVGRYSPGLVRTSAFWPCFERQPRTYTFQECYQDYSIRQLSEEGLKLSLVMSTRTNVSRGLPEDFWGTHEDGTVHDPEISYPPNDLSDVWSDNYGYSQNYYNFLKTFLQHYADLGIFFHSIVIENEANSDLWFIGTPGDPDASMEQYIRMVATAKKAVVDLGLSSKTKVYDSGLQGGIAVLAMNDYLRDNRPYDAWLLYQKVNGPAYNTPAAVRDYVASALTTYPVRAAKYLIENQNSLIYKGKMADGLNFHFYGYPEGIPEILAYVRKMLPLGFPLVTNELGINSLPGTLAERRDIAGRIMLEDYSTILTHADGMILWFTTAGSDGASHDGAIIDGWQNLVPSLAEQYKGVLDIFDGKVLSSVDLSQSYTMRFDLKFSDRGVSVEWIRPMMPSITKTATSRDGCAVYDSTGIAVPAGDPYTMDPSRPFVTICYPAAPSSSPQPPVLEFIPDLSSPALEPVSFIVEATDPYGTTPVLSVSPLPSGATFARKAPGISVFSWTPSKDQAGNYNLTFTASDGTLVSSQEIALVITPPVDSDGDGMADIWELETFLTLSHTGTQDTDKDGISNLDEYQKGLNPLVSDAPSTPVIRAPGEGSEVATFRPALTVTNGTDPHGLPLTVVFQVTDYYDNKMTKIFASKVLSPGTQGKTSWQVPAGVLAENASYRWRAFMENQYTDSLPVYGTFFINTVNDPPKYFSIVAPADGAVVTTRTPTLSVTKAVDPDKDAITYGFKVYAADKATLLASVSGLPQKDTISWHVDHPLTDNSRYFWQGIATDSHGLTTATLLHPFDINVAAEPPLADDLSVSVTEDKSVAITATATDVDGDPLTYSIVAPPVNGTLTGTLPKVIYTPAKDFNGTDSFTFKANDGTHDSNTAAITITVSAVNDPPTISSIAPLTIREDHSTGPIAFVIGDVDSSIGKLTVTATTGNIWLLPPGSIVLGGSGANRIITVKPAKNMSGQANIRLTVSDGAASKSTTFSLTVVPVNDPPAAISSTVNIWEDHVWTGRLHATDAEGDHLTYTLVTTGTKGAAVLTDPITGDCTYTPAHNANGQDSFTFRANDGNFDSQVATITVNIAAVNDPPVADSQSIVTDEDTPVAVTLTGSDVDLDPLTYSVVKGPYHGVLSGTAPNLTYTPSANYNGPDSFTFKVNDGQVYSVGALVNLTVRSVNDAPTISAITSQTTNEDVRKVIWFSVRDTETPASDLRLQAASDNLNLVPPTAIVIGGTGSSRSIAVTPSLNKSGKANITATVTDGDGVSASTTFQLTVLAVNDAPVANDAVYNTKADTALSGRLTGSDVENSVLTFSLVINGSLGKAVITDPSSGAFTYTPRAGAQGQDYFTFKAFDGKLYSKSAKIALNITAASN